MFYVKTTLNNKPIKVDIYGDDIYTTCYTCGKEMIVDDELLKFALQEGDLSSTKLSCCEASKPTLKRIK